MHDAFKKRVPYYPTAAEICKEIEDFILELQQKTTLPQRFSIEELTEQGAVWYGGNELMAYQREQGFTAHDEISYRQGQNPKSGSARLNLKLFQLR